MAPTFEAVRAEAVERADGWGTDADGRDLLSAIDRVASGALRVEAFEALLPLGLAVAGLQANLGSGGLLGLAKRRGWDRPLRTAGLRALALRASAPRAVNTVDVVFFSELATPSTLEPMLAVAAAIPAHRRRAIVADPRAYRAWSAAGHNPMPAILPAREQARILKRSQAAAHEAWRALVSQPATITFGDSNVTGAAQPQLRRIVMRSAPWLAVEREALRRHLEASQPRWLVLASDQHRLGRVAVDVARACGVRTLVLQHGLPQWRLGFVPIVADEVATWSEASDRWFLAEGAPPERLTRLGNPRLDALVGLDRDRLARAVESSMRLEAKPRLLLALSPNDEARNLQLIDLALGALEAAPDAGLVVKLHPTDGRWEAARARIRARSVADRVRVARREPLYPLLAWADAVLVHRSTVAVEALAAGTPVVVGAVGAPSPDDALPADVKLPEVESSTALLGVLAGLASETARLAFIDDRRMALERLSGPVDGRVAERIAVHLGAAE